MFDDTLEKMFDDTLEDDVFLEDSTSNDESQHTREPSSESVIENPLDYLTDHQLIDHVHELETELRHLKLENKLFEDFLQNNDPSSLEGVNDILRYALGYSTMKPILPHLSPAPQDLRHSSAGSVRRSVRLESFSSVSSLIEGRGPKVNLSQKTDMILKAMEEMQSNLESFVRKSHRTKRNLKAELEEFSIRESDIREARDIFEFNIVTQGIDKLTQRIPAEKFIRYMEEWLKSAQLNIEKLRLRTASLRVQYKKVSGILVQRQELGENVHAVDFDQLEIENKHLMEKIEQKHVHLIELKKMNGGANLVLSKHKKYLQKQLEDYNKLKDEVVLQEKAIEASEKEYDEEQEEVEKARNRYEFYKNLKNTYKVPEVMEYVRVKSELYDLKKNIKIWQRRKKIQDITLNACIRQMKNITGSPKVDQLWLQDPTPDIYEATEESISE